MNDRKDSGDRLDRSLAASFARMKQEDQANLPAFPDMDRLRQTAPASNAARRERYWWRAAGLAAAITVAAVLLMPSPAPDPGELYADIMQANSMTTDQLMLPSPGILPEVTGLPGVYDIDMPSQLLEYAN